MSQTSTISAKHVRELAEERVAILISESDMPVAKAEIAAIRWAKQEYGVTLRVVFDAERELPLTGLIGRVLWPVRDAEPQLTTQEKLAALEVAAVRTVNRRAVNQPFEIREAYRLAILTRLAAEEGVPAAAVEEYLGYVPA